MRWPRWVTRHDADVGKPELRDAERHLAEAEGRWSKVDEITERLTATVHRNHFTESIVEAFRRRA